jgi:hypothetical protein
MKYYIRCLVIIFFNFSVTYGFEIPPQVVNAIANDAWGARHEPSITRDELRSYMRDNWRHIAANIESLPIAKFDANYRKDRALPSMSLFIADCEGLSASEYLEFLDQMLGLYEQRRISYDAFKHSICPELEKRDFISVNYSHPRVAAYLQKAIALIPADDLDMKALLEADASGSLADNYMTDRGDDDPLPETLPGVKLKRPWGSIIRKYEKLTGNKVPDDPDFPDEAQTRPVRRSRVNTGSDALILRSETSYNERNWRRIAALSATFACLAAVLAAIIHMRRKNSQNRSAK